MFFWHEASLRSVIFNQFQVSKMTYENDAKSLEKQLTWSVFKITWQRFCEFISRIVENVENNGESKSGKITDFGGFVGDPRTKHSQREQTQCRASYDAIDAHGGLKNCFAKSFGAISSQYDENSSDKDDDARPKIGIVAHSAEVRLQLVDKDCANAVDSAGDGRERSRRGRREEKSRKSFVFGKLLHYHVRHQLIFLFNHTNLNEILKTVDFAYFGVF